MQDGTSGAPRAQHGPCKLRNLRNTARGLDPMRTPLNILIIDIRLCSLIRLSMTARCTNWCATD